MSPPPLYQWINFGRSVANVDIFTALCITNRRLGQEPQHPKLSVGEISLDTTIDFDISDVN